MWVPEVGQITRLWKRGKLRSGFWEIRVDRRETRESSVGRPAPAWFPNGPLAPET